MKVIGYVVLQALALNFVGIKGDGNDPSYCRVYTTKDDARDFLIRLLSQIQQEQSIGWRTKDNLDPKKKLDFYIQKVEMEIPTENIKKRGWKIKDE